MLEYMEGKFFSLMLCYWLDISFPCDLCMSYGLTFFSAPK